MFPIDKFSPADCAQMELIGTRFLFKSMRVEMVGPQRRRSKPSLTRSTFFDPRTIILLRLLFRRISEY